jgi:hypothetical protein
MFDSLIPTLTSIESKIPIQALQRDAFVRESTYALKAASTADRAKLPGALTSAEQVVGKLQILDGGLNSALFKKDIEAVNSAVNPITDHSHQYLPFLEVSGVNSQGRIQVSDITDGKTETLVDDHNLLEPTAPSVQGDKAKLYAGTGADALKPGNIQQGRLGDCYFLAALQSVVAKDPESVPRMIHDNGTGKDGAHTYTVTFPGAKNNPVTISQPNSYDVAVSAQDAGGLWTNVLEKAHRELTGKDMHDDGGDPADAIKLLTGKQASSIALGKISNPQDVANLLSTVNSHEITAGTARASIVVDASGNAVDVVAQHDYSVVGYNAKTQMVTLSNPQDLNSVEGKYRPESGNIHMLNSFDGLLQKTQPELMEQPYTGRLVTMSLPDFFKNFAEIALS